MIKGADISEYRKVTSWSSYVASGRSFIALKATGGAKGWNYTDPDFARSLAGAKAAGLHVIAYHFLRQADGRLQADHFLSKVPHKGVVLVCDFEFHKPTNSFPTAAQLSAFVLRVKEVTGRWPWVYTSRGVWGSLVSPATTRVAPECGLWIADWTDPLEPVDFGGWSKALLRQYTDAGTVPGIDKPCDDNVLLGTPLDLLRGAWGSENVSAQDRGWGPPCPTADIVRIDAGGRSFNVHKRVARIFQMFITELVDRGYDIKSGTLDDWSYNCRKIAGSDSWSNHAWGLAIDINSLKNPMGSTLVTNMPAWVRDADYLLKKYGLKWGGTYKTRPDAMHFEFILTPADADRLTAALGDGDDMSAADVEAIKDHVDARADQVTRRVLWGLVHDISDRSWVTDDSGYGDTPALLKANGFLALRTLLAGQADDEAKILAAISGASNAISTAVIAGLKEDGVIVADVDEDQVAARVSERVEAALQNITFTANRQDPAPTG